LKTKSSTLFYLMGTAWLLWRAQVLINGDTLFSSNYARACSLGFCGLMTEIQIPHAIVFPIEKSSWKDTDQPDNIDCMRYLNTCDLALYDKARNLFNPDFGQWGEMSTSTTIPMERPPQI